MKDEPAPDTNPKTDEGIALTPRPTTDNLDARRHSRSPGWQYDFFLEPVLRGIRLQGRAMARPRVGMSILDVGCGTGAHLKLYQESQADLTGIDVSPAMIGAARSKLGHSASLHLGDASAMPYAYRSFDLIFSMLALHGMAPLTRSTAIDEMKRVLKQSGRILLIDFHPGPLRPLDGWIVRLAIHAIETIAGGDHYTGYRHFMANGGLPTLIGEHDLEVEHREIVAGGTMALYLLSPRE